jgi:hypothetical protein
MMWHINPIPSFWPGRAASGITLCGRCYGAGYRGAPLPSNEHIFNESNMPVFSCLAESENKVHHYSESHTIVNFTEQAGLINNSSPGPLKRDVLEFLDAFSHGPDPPGAVPDDAHSHDFSVHGAFPDDNMSFTAKRRRLQATPLVAAAHNVKVKAYSRISHGIYSSHEAAPLRDPSDSEASIKYSRSGPFAPGANVHDQSGCAQFGGATGVIGPTTSWRVASSTNLLRGNNYERHISLPPGSREIVPPVVSEHNLNNWNTDLGFSALQRLGYEPSSSSTLDHADSFPNIAARRACKSSALHVFDIRALGTEVRVTAPATSIGNAVRFVESSEWTSQRPRDGLSERFISAPSLAVFSQQSDNSNRIGIDMVDTNAPT